MKPGHPAADAAKRLSGKSTGHRSVDAPEGDRRWMKVALRLAKKAMQMEETPVGAVVVRDGVILGRGYNRRELFSDVTQHAELMAIRQAERKLGSWRLDGCDLYATLEPCIMCAGAIVQARVENVFYGAADPKAGAGGSIVDVFAIRQNHQVQVSGGLMADECAQILKQFFRLRREENISLGTRAERRICREENKSLGTRAERRAHTGNQEKTDDKPL